mmetsp:Transcript_3154/g.6855  ORF Transcript_3154/g.6855 Transcript_3154/m.6855 type:complete len:404 (+) Transcript_3154:511-1722(+)
MIGRRVSDVFFGKDFQFPFENGDHRRDEFVAFVLAVSALVVIVVVVVVVVVVVIIVITARRHVHQDVFKRFGNILVFFHGGIRHARFHLDFGIRQSHAKGIPSAEGEGALRSEEIDDSGDGGGIDRGRHGMMEDVFQPRLEEGDVVVLGVDLEEFEVSVVGDEVFDSEEGGRGVARGKDGVVSPGTPLVGMRPVEAGFGGGGESRVSEESSYQSCVVIVIRVERMIGSLQARMSAEQRRSAIVSNDFASDPLGQVGSFGVDDSGANSFERWRRRTGRIVILFVIVMGRFEGDDSSGLSTSHHGDADHLLQNIQGGLPSVHGKPRRIQQQNAKVAAEANQSVAGATAAGTDGHPPQTVRDESLQRDEVGDDGKGRVSKQRRREGASLEGFAAAMTMETMTRHGQ